MNIKAFRDPPKEYREVPFWSWNDDLEPEELVRQVALMDEAGWGGFFMHSRVGLRTPYMGPRWLECVRACVDAARERGMGAWLYDEDKWPSGAAGGLSVAAEPSYRDQRLVCKVDDRPALLAERIATFSAREVDGRLVDVRMEDEPSFGDDADRVIQFYPQTAPLAQPWFNDYTYLDLLNPDAVRAFLDVTHEVYARHVGDDFGGAVPGVFTDEPCFMFGGYTSRRSGVPWTEGFLALFQERNGYDLLPHLPALFFDVGDYQGVRYDYWRTVTERFIESFSRPLYDWCEAHGLAFTGHYMAEDSLLGQVLWIGAAMPHYPYMHVPGIDKLGREINTWAGTALTVKQLDSVACQLGKPRTLCENYGCSGQNFAHRGRKWIGDWAYVLGINLNNPHLSLYTMRGERKRDYPQNIFYQQPWWPENRMIADYFARLSYVLSQGERVVDVLVVHPLGSGWTVYAPGQERAIRVLDARLDGVLMTLLRSQRDLHLGDEMLMEPGAPCEARVETGEDGPRLCLGQGSYRVVVVPPGVTLAANTVRVLAEFAAAGGPVLALEPLPTLVNGRRAEGAVLPEGTRVVTLDGLPGALDELLPFDVRVAGRPDVWVHHRRVGERDCYFLANTSLEVGGVATVQLRGTGLLEEWDPATGDVRPLPSRQADGVTEVVLDIPPVGSRLLVLHGEREPAAVEWFSGLGMSDIVLGDRWELTLDGPNALTLDTAEVYVGAEAEERAEAGYDAGSHGFIAEVGVWQGPMHVLDAHGVVAAAGAGSPFALRFTFEASVAPGPVHLVVESSERFEIEVNGRAVEGTDAGWWIDKSFRKLDVSSAVRAGLNLVVLRGVFARDTELESVYLIGPFGVAGRRLREENRHTGEVFDRYAPEFRLAPLPATARAGGEGLALDLTSRGLPFFAGRATLRQVVTLPAYYGEVVMDLELQGLRAAVARVRVNGEEAGAVAWPPYRVRVTEGLRAGENEIEVELVGTLRNLLGPHHVEGGDLSWTGPETFRDKRRWTEDYTLVPFGFERAVLRVTVVAKE